MDNLRMNSESTITKRRFFCVSGIATVSAVLGTVIAVSTQVSVENKPINYACDCHEVLLQEDDVWNETDADVLKNAGNVETKDDFKINKNKHNQSDHYDVASAQDLFDYFNNFGISDHFSDEDDSFNSADFLRHIMIRAP